MTLLENEKAHYYRILQSNLYHNKNRKNIFILIHLV